MFQADMTPLLANNGDCHHSDCRAGSGKLFNFFFMLRGKLLANKIFQLNIGPGSGSVGTLDKFFLVQLCPRIRST